MLEKVLLRFYKTLPLSNICEFTFLLEVVHVVMKGYLREISKESTEEMTEKVDVHRGRIKIHVLKAQQVCKDVDLEEDWTNEELIEWSKLPPLKRD
jgi:hypothetical protein